MLAMTRALERGTIDGPVARALEGVYERLFGRNVVRRLRCDSSPPLVVVGGATLGGSGKTPLAIACASELAATGARTVFVGHAYRARPRRPRFVEAHDRASEVGDEALVAARALAPRGVPVVVAPKRAAAVDFASRDADVIVIDGVAQTAPLRATLALLAVDAEEPWGRARALPPRGDLRASPTALLDACDAVVPLGADPSAAAACLAGTLGRPTWPARVESRGAWVEGASLLPWETLRGKRLGLLLAVARPDRVVRSLAERGVRPEVVVSVRDHGPLSRRALHLVAKARDLDLWLMTGKCAVHTAEQGLTRRVRVATLDHSVALPPELCSRLRALGPRLDPRWRRQ